MEDSASGQQADQIAETEPNLEEGPSADTKNQKSRMHEHDFGTETREHAHWIGARQDLELQEYERQHLNYNQCQETLDGVRSMLVREMFVDHKHAGDCHQQGWKNSLVVLPVQERLRPPHRVGKHYDEN
jgi:hypothetical protein